MKKTVGFLSIVVLAFFMTASPVSADVERVGGGGEEGFWSMLGTFVIDYVCTSGCTGTYPHEMRVTGEDTEAGTFDGDGNYIPNSAYTWDLTGTVLGDLFEALITYTGLNPGYTVDLDGAIDEDGMLSGTAESSTGQTFDFTSTEGSSTWNEGDAENHGQYVKGQEDKRAAAHDRIGMPVKSNGHLKGKSGE